MGQAKRDEAERERNDEGRAPGGGERVRIEPAGRGACAIGARRRQKRERRQRRRAGERRDQHQAKRCAPEPAVERRGQRADAQDERDRESRSRHRRRCGCRA